MNWLPFVFFVAALFIGFVAGYAVKSLERDVPRD